MSASLRQSFLSGVKWTTAARVGSAGMQFLRAAVLARFLRPADFGLMAIVNVFLGYATAYADLGVGSAIVQREDLDEDRFSTLVWLGISAGVAVFLLLLGVSPWIVAFFDEPRLKPLLWVSAVSFLLLPWGQAFQKRMERETLFDLIGAIEFSTMFLGVAVSIVYAWLGHGVWSLVYGQICQSGLRGMAFGFYGFRRWGVRFVLRLGSIGPYLRFGGFLMANRTVNYFNAQADQLILGKFMGPDVLGYYSLALQLVLKPMWHLNAAINRVLFPVLSKMQNERERLTESYLKVTRAMASLNAPVLAGAAAVAGLLVPVLFGVSWMPVAAMMPALAIIAFLRGSVEPAANVVYATGDAGRAFRFTCFQALVGPLSLWFSAAHAGVWGVLYCLIALEMLYAFASYFYWVRPVCGNCGLKFLGAIAHPGVLAVLMGWSVFALPAGFGLLGKVFLGLLLYPTTLWATDRKGFSEISSIFSKRP